MLSLKAERQSICPPYAQKTDSSNNHEGKNVNKRKKSETVLAVAMLLNRDFTIERNEMACICGISPQEISSAMKKIEKILSQGHIVIGLNEIENEKLKNSFELRNRNQKYSEDLLIRSVARVLLKDYRLTGNQMAKELNESTMNISRAIKKIKERVGYNLDLLADLGGPIGIAGLSQRENEELLIKITTREKEIETEKKRRQQEKELEIANRESIRDMDIRSKNKKISKKPTSISDEGLADWNRMHYDPVTGNLKIAKTSIPGDMPRRYPKKQIAVQLSTPDSYLIPGIPPKGSGTAAGRRRIRIMQMS